MDKDKQARLEAKGWRFGDADEFLGADAGQLEVDETYKTDNVEALVAENARLKAEVAAANKGNYILDSLKYICYILGVGCRNHSRIQEKMKNDRF